MNFSKTIINWYLENKRDLPWRNTTDAYRIWLSEIMLQQTRVNQGLPYYLKFINAFPTVYELAKASQDKVLKLWQGLGYYSRARNLHFTAKEIVEKYNGKFPNTYDELLQLKGVGSYTAAAISSISFNKANAVVDGNVFRLLSRVYGIYTPVDTGAGKREFDLLANRLLDKDNPAAFNQSMMDLGAVVCKPKQPDCHKCPLNVNCFAHTNNATIQLPVKSKTKTVKKRYFNYLIYYADSRQIALHKRTKNDIWRGLYEFPVIESSGKMTKKSLLADKDKLNGHFKAIKDFVLLNKEPVIHKLTHQHIYASFWIDSKLKKNISNLDFSPIKEKPVSVLTAGFVKSLIG
ncbi:MAG: A/G-specific adenine glycosylase [Flavobacteriales bacterium]|nr:MAG: A/G-specific adenine glycosylase [Flavobacteriales bacterium]